MAGLIASGIIKWTASKLSSLVSAPIGSSSSSDEEQTSAVRDVQMLQRTMASVQRTLEAADEDSIREVSGRLRLRELQQFAYDAQDAIDEYKFELLRRRMDDPDGHREDRSTRKRKRKGDKKVLAVTSLTLLFSLVDNKDVVDYLVFCSNCFDLDDWSNHSTPKKYKKLPVVHLNSSKHQICG